MRSSPFLIGLSLRQQTNKNQQKPSILLLPTQKDLFYGKAKPFVSCPKKRTSGKPEEVWYITCSRFVLRISVLPFSVKSQGAEWTHRLSRGRLAQGTLHAFSITLNLGKMFFGELLGRWMLHTCVSHSIWRPSVSAEQLPYFALLTTADRSPKAHLHLNPPQSGLGPCHVDTLSFAHSHVCG